jgi:predicted ATPase/DNA-binding CsgD family transcriptional regulator
MDNHDHEVLPLAQPLTGRELEVLTHIGDGLANRQIAEQMTVAMSTIKWYVRQIYNKLGVDNRTDAIIRARELGILTDLDDVNREHVKLPPQFTSFVGRRREIAEVRQLLMTSRLVTLTGPGGSGKTRLAVQVARVSTGQYRDGVYFVSLASIIDPALVPNAIAQVIGVTEQPNIPLVGSLNRFFGQKQLLLLLDNFEHLIEAASLVTDLLTSTSGLTILVTSRESLRLSGEYEYLVPPLIVPDLALVDSVADLAKYESVALFVQRAEASSTYFTLTDDNAVTVANICSRLDGLPLAIELAAARIKLFNPEQLLERLDDRLGLLTGGPRDLPARQQTLRNTIDWSYELLDEDEQILFARLGVFSGGRSLEAIEAVCSPGLNIEIMDGIESMLNKSLLYQREDTRGEPRFMMLETIHEYALERLARGGEEQSVRNRHLSFFLDLMEEAEANLRGPDQVTWLNLMEIEHDNLLAAVDWSQSNKEAAGLGLRLIGALAQYLQIRGYYSEGRELLSLALSGESTDQNSAARAKVLSLAGLFAYMQGDYPATRSSLEESLAIYRELGPDGRKGLAGALITLGDMETEVGEYATASSLIKEALGIMRELDNARGISRALWQLGACAVRPGNYEEAVQYFEAALPILRQIGDRTSTGIAISGLAEVAIRQGDYERATDLEEESLALRREIGEAWGIAVSLGNFAWIALRQDDLRQAVAFLGESMLLRCDIGDKGGVAWCLEKMAEIALTKGLAESSTSRTEEFRRAATLFGAAAALRAPSSSVIDLVDEPEYERQLAEVRANLDRATFDAAWEAGGGMTLEQAVDYALNED